MPVPKECLNHQKFKCIFQVIESCTKNPPADCKSCSEASCENCDTASASCFSK